jgi:hypothetical protein
MRRGPAEAVRRPSWTRSRAGVAGRGWSVVRPDQTVKLLPQPQPPAEFGLLKVKPEPWKVET